MFFFKEHFNFQKVCVIKKPVSFSLRACKNLKFSKKIVVMYLLLGLVTNVTKALQQHTLEIEISYSEIVLFVERLTSLQRGKCSFEWGMLPG